MKNIFAIFRARVAPEPPMAEAMIYEDFGPANIFASIWEPTHVHVRTGKQYMVTSDGERLEVTGDQAYPLVEYEDAEGKRFAQRADRFHDGRFQEVD